MTMGQFIVIVGPTASGKTVLTTELLKRLPNAARLITTTTRTSRLGERDGVDYYFVSRADFEEGIRNGDFFEHAEVHGNLYGSSRKAVVSAVQKFDTVLATLDIQGARTLRDMDSTVQTLFLRPGSLAELEQRLRTKRAGISDDEIVTRLKTAERELAVAEEFDRIIENVDGQFESTVAQALAFVNESTTSRA
ncbi:MAG: guanylate kinase [Patescibacteria group bacterium]|nr:guanylate kinase [Patescibacteria group bacterium]